MRTLKEFLINLGQRYFKLAPSGTYTADRTLNVALQDADRTLTFTADATLPPPVQLSVTRDAAGLKLVGDGPTTTGSLYYGTLAGSDLGYHALPQATNSGEWNFSNNVTVADPGSGKVRINDADVSLANVLALSALTSNNTNVAQFLRSLRNGDSLYVQDKSDSTKWVRYNVTGTATDNTSWFSIPISYVAGGAGGGISNNEPLVLTFSTAGGGGGTGGTGGSGMVKIAEVVVGAGGQATVDFSSIPQTYEHLRINFSGNSDGSSGTGVYLYYNNDTTLANYLAQRSIAQGTGTTAQTFSASAYVMGLAATTVATPSCFAIEIPYYARSVRKAAYSLGGYEEAVGINVDQWYTRWTGTAAVTRVTLAVSGANFKQGTIVQLWGVSGTGGGGGSGAAAVVPGTAEGRLTLTSGTAVTSADVVGASTLYFTPYQGNVVALYSGSAWVSRTLTERSLALSGLTAGKNYDVFLYDNAGTPALELSAAWSADLTRTDALALQDGVVVKSGAPSRLHLGIIRATAATTTEDSTQKRFVVNRYGRVRRPLFTCPGYVDDNAYTQYQTTSTTWVRANGGTGSRVELLSLGEDPTDYNAAAAAANNTAANGLTFLGVGEDSISQARVAAFGQAYASGANFAMAATGRAVTLAAGYHFLELLIAVSTGTGQFYADVVRLGGTSDPYGTFLRGTVMG